jgi:hypothetical protein
MYRKSIGCIEDLSNELFYEIFDYLDGCELYEAFSNLNGRFKDILSCSSLRLKINLSFSLERQSEQRSINIIVQNRYNILSLRLMNRSAINRFFTSIVFDSSFHRLESLVLKDISSNHLIPILVSLTCLPRLFSLDLYVAYKLNNFDGAYRIIFSLPVLRYIKFSSDSYQPLVPLTIATNKQFSTIEYLNIDHSCRLDHFIAILSHTPRLNRLVCRQLIESNVNVERVVPPTLSTLIHICISGCYLMFNKLESIIRKIHSPVRTFRISTYWGEAYLDADRWERLILQYMPHLREFYFQHHEFIDDDFEVTEYHTRINRFMSSFWIERRSIFELEIDVSGSLSSKIIYSMHPYR